MVKYRYHGSGYKNRMGSPASYSEDFLLSLYQSMTRIRLVELEIANRYHENLMKTPVHLQVGQEATPVGLCAALRQADLLYLSHRSHGGYLAKGGDLKAMMSELYCKSNGCAGSRGGSMHLIDRKAGVAGTSAIVAGIIPIATGSALASQIKKNDVVSAVLFGDAATEEGAMSESLNFAALKKLPVIFFCENNFYSVQSPLDVRQPAVSIAARAAGFGVAAEVVDGVNVLDVYEVTLKAVERARRGLGPTFIEAPAYRWLAHAGASDDSATGYREVAEREAWQREGDPISLFGAYLEQLGIMNNDIRYTMEAALKKEINEVFAHAIASPIPTKEHLFQNSIYALG